MAATESYTTAGMIANSAAALSPTKDFRSALRLALVFAFVKLVVHIAANRWQAHLGWGYFRDEPYYILCGRYLDWGYVDHGPIVALQARLAVMLFGKSLAGIRMLTSLAGAVEVLFTGLLAWQLGAGRVGQAIALAGALLAPTVLGMDSFLSMNSFEPIFWMLAAMAVLKMLQDGGSWWVVLGAAAGLGFENKPSIIFFLAALLLGLAVTPERNILLTRNFWLSVGLGSVLALPFLLWQVRHDWATLRFLRNAKAVHDYSRQSVSHFLAGQVITVGVATLPLAAAGLWWLLASKRAVRFRFLGYTYLFFLGIMLLLRESGKEYYLAPVYPLLFSAGGVACEAYGAAKRNWIVPAYTGFFVVMGIIATPLMLLYITPQQWMRAYAALHLRRPGTGPLTDFLAMEFGWQELTDDIARVYDALSPSERSQAGIYCWDYGPASAINFLGSGRGLPFAISGHNNYFLWGPHGETGAVMIVVTTKTAEQLLEEYDRVDVVGSMHHPYAPKWGANIYLCRGRKVPFSVDWENEKSYR